MRATSHRGRRHVHHGGLRLSPRHRRAAYAIALLAWLSGVAWLLLHYFFQVPGAFGPAPHPLEAWSLRVHGAAAFLALWAAGLIWALHARIGLGMPNRRRSGLWLLALGGVLIISGYLLYYAGDDALRDGVRLVHWVVGVAAIVPFLVHALRGRAQREASARDARPDA